MSWHDLCRRQGGVISLSQLLASTSIDRVDGLVRRGDVVFVLPGVYRHAATPLTVKGRRFAAALWSGGAVSFGTAGSMWDLGAPDDPTTIDVSVADRRSRNGHPGFVRVHRVLLGAHDVETVEGLAVTTRTRTALDLAGSLPRRSARTVFEQGFRSGWFTLADLDARLEREKGRAGNVALRQFRTEIAPGAQGVFERRFQAVLRAAGITGWEPHYKIRTSTGGLVEVDIAFPGARLIIELDGRKYHEGDPRFGADRKRDRRTLVTGWKTLRYVWGDLDSPEEIIVEIRCLVAA